MPAALIGAYLTAIAHPSLPIGNLVLMLAVLWASWKLSRPAPAVDDTQIAGLKTAVEKLTKDVAELSSSSAISSMRTPRK